jgi:hypothetical protein
MQSVGHDVARVLVGKFFIHPDSAESIGARALPMIQGCAKILSPHKN